MKIKKLIMKTAHDGHQVQWRSYEAMTYRLYCLTCGKYTAMQTQTPGTLAKFTYGKDAG